MIEVDENQSKTLDDSDDCQILNEEEVQHVNDSKKHSGMHMDDELNVPNANGEYRYLRKVNCQLGFCEKKSILAK